MNDTKQRSAELKLQTKKHAMIYNEEKCATSNRIVVEQVAGKKLQLIIGVERVI